MGKHSKSLAATTLVALATTLSPAAAADWIESVKVERNGIDTVPIEVRAGKNGYTSVKTAKHTFNLRLYARAKSGKRIAKGAVGSYNGVRAWEASHGSKWEKKLSHRDVGGGTLRTMDRTFSYKIPVSKLSWHGKNPIEACNALMLQKMGQGASPGSVLSKSWVTSAKVFFQFDAVAARKNVATKASKLKLGNTTSERKSGHYDVRVKCLSNRARAS